MENEQGKRNFLIKMAVIFFSVLIFIFWFLNSRDIFNFKEEETASEENAVQIESLRQEFEEALDKINKELEDFRADEDLRKITDSILLEVINSEISKIASSSSEAITLPETNNCPAYVNCMPTIGAVPSCQIPPGCEGITQIVY